MGKQQDVEKTNTSQIWFLAQGHSGEFLPKTLKYNPSTGLQQTINKDTVTSFVYLYMTTVELVTTN